MRVKGFHGDEITLCMAPWYKTHLSPTQSCRLSFKGDDAGCLQLAPGPPQWDMARVATPQLQSGHFPSILVVLLMPSLLPTHLHRCARALRDAETTSDYSCSLEQRWEILHLPCLGITEKPHFSLAIHPHPELQATQHKAPTQGTQPLRSRVFPSLQG